MSNKITSYQDACKYLDDMQMHKIKLGLDAVRTTLANLGSPEQKCPAVHVAGTNGKGSVCSMLRSIMTKAGYRTGLYTSPHLSSVRERFRVDDRFIGEDEFTCLMERIRSSLSGKSITYFECATALAFSWFAEQKCDLVIIETGMGGRLDATNVLTPMLSMITTISLDHEQYLGDTVEAVAFEKAGIIKPVVPVISGVLDLKAQPVIIQACLERGSSIITRGTDFSMELDDDDSWCWNYQDKMISGLAVPKGAAWQVENSAMAVAAAVSLREHGYHVADTDIRIGLCQARWPGRMEFIQLAWGEKNLSFLLDGAHNSAAVGYLVDALEKLSDHKKMFLVWASMSDKTYEKMLKKVAGLADYVILTRPDSERSASLSDLAGVLDKELSEQQISCHESVEETLQEVCSLAKSDDLIVVAGSLYLVGVFRKLLVGEVAE